MAEHVYYSSHFGKLVAATYCILAENEYNVDKWGAKWGKVGKKVDNFLPSKRNQSLGAI